MRTLGLIVGVLLITAVGAAFCNRGSSGEPGSAGQGSAQGTAAARGGGGGGMGGPGGGPPGFGGGFAPRQPMTVELASVNRADVVSTITVVGNLIGAATVEAVPKVAGRLQSVFVRLGDRVSRGQPVAKIEDREILEQVKQAEASFNVAEATVRQRQADLRFADTNLERSRSLFDRQLLSRQSMDDADARSQASTAQLDLARAQFEQAKARLEELRINLANTVVPSPVDGFVGRRSLDQGAWVTTNSSFISVVDISFVRLVANVVEQDLRRVQPGATADVEVDAYPGENFAARVARVAPVLDPATRTAQIEVEVPNPGFRLKPGMYARVRFTVERHPKALVVPTNALVNLQGKRGVFVSDGGKTAKFQAVVTGIEQREVTEITQGLQEGDRVVTTGAAALRDGDSILLAAQAPGRPGGGPGQTGRSGRGEQASGTQPATSRSNMRSSGVQRAQ